MRFRVNVDGICVKKGKEKTFLLTAIISGVEGKSFHTVPWRSHLKFLGVGYAKCAIHGHVFPNRELATLYPNNVIETVT